LLLQNFGIIAFSENFEFEFNFSNSSNFEKFLKKVPNIMKNAFFIQIIFSLFVSNQRKTIFKMATFRVGGNIFFIFSLKNHMTWFCDFWSKIFENILKIFSFLVQKFSKLFFWNKRRKILRMQFFIFSKMSSFCFVALVHTHNF
jgi:hypothetical protein